jgi:hypothetical protein
MVSQKNHRGDRPEIAGLAADLLGRPVDACEPIRKGGNNSVYRVESRGENFILKCYNPQRADPRDRFGAESGALQFLNRHGIRNVPKVIAASERDHCALYSWLEEAQPPHAPNEADVYRLADFLIDLQKLRQASGANKLPAAADACLSLAATLRTAQRRIDRLKNIAAATPELRGFFFDGLLPLLQRFEDRLKRAYGGEIEMELPPAHRMLSPSDFGFHNAVRQPDGAYAFFDFEYFGWDDPVKATVDVAYHAAMDLPPELGQAFTMRMLDFWTAIDADFPRRLRLARGLYGVIWCCIILNEFLPERWERRVMAKGDADRGQVQRQQLQKARRFFARMKEENHESVG